jgi:hypothetical protein
MKYELQRISSPEWTIVRDRIQGRRQRGGTVVVFGWEEMNRIEWEFEVETKRENVMR